MLCSIRTYPWVSVSWWNPVVSRGSPPGWTHCLMLMSTLFIPTPPQSTASGESARSAEKQASNPTVTAVCISIKR